MNNFHAHSGQIYLNTVPLSPTLVDELLTLFANEGAVDLVCALTRARREARAYLPPMPELKPLTCVVRELDPEIWKNL